jgi:SPX domain protein involved in polyphosphate accumulation
MTPLDNQPIPPKPEILLTKLRHPDRFELKYVITLRQYEALATQLPAFMRLDRQGDEEGRYLITSLYYDSPDYRAYWNKLDGHRFRRKVRVRVYGNHPVTPQTPCFAEIKQRTNKTLQKKRTILPYSLAEELCGLGNPPPASSTTDQAVIDEIIYIQRMLALQPACVVTYQRLAFEGREYDPGLRVTFDTQLKCRGHDLTLLSLRCAENQYFMPPDYCILEVKANHRVPYWLTQLIGQHRCTLRRVSKYCAALEAVKQPLLHRRTLV